MDALKKLSNVLDTMCIWIMSACLLVMTVCLIFLIFGRNLFNISFASMEEISRFTLVWVTFFGACVAYKRNEHMAFDFLIVRMPQGVQRVVRIIRELILLALVFIMIYYGVELVHANLGQISLQAMIPVGYVYVVFPITGAVMFVHGLSHLICQAGGVEEPVMEKVLVD